MTNRTEVSERSQDTKARRTEVLPELQQLSARHQPMITDIHQHQLPTNSNYKPNPTHETTIILCRTLLTFPHISDARAVHIKN